MGKYVFYTFCLIITSIGLMGCTTLKPEDCDPTNNTNLITSLRCGTEMKAKYKRQQMEKELEQSIEPTRQSIELEELGIELDKLTSEIDGLEKLITELERKESQLVSRPGGCPEGSPCPSIGDCIDVDPIGDGLGWDGKKECEINEGDLEKFAELETKQQMRVAELKKLLVHLRSLLIQVEQ